MALSDTSGEILSMNPAVIAWGTAFTPINRSEQPSPPNSRMETITVDSLTVFIALVGLVGNAIVLWLLGFRLRRNVFSVYILNLAGADFTLLCCSIFHSLMKLINYFCSSSYFIPDIFTKLSDFAYIAGLSFLSAISMERCLSALWPIWYRCHRPRHTSTVMCALLWALSLLLSTLEGYYCGFLNGGSDLSWCSALDFITVAWLILLFVLLSGSSLALLIRMLCSSHQVPLTRLYVTVGLTVLAFLLCGLPFGIYWFLIFWTSYDTDDFFPLYWIGRLLSSVNSCANPIIYFFVGSLRQHWRKRHQTLRLVLQRALQDTPEGDEEGGSLPQGALEMSGSSLVS